MVVTLWSSSFDSVKSSSEDEIAMRLMSTAQMWLPLVTSILPDAAELAERLQNDEQELHSISIGVTRALIAIVNDPVWETELGSQVKQIIDDAVGDLSSSLDMFSIIVKSSTSVISRMDLFQEVVANVSDETRTAVVSVPIPHSIFQKTFLSFLQNFDD